MITKCRSLAAVTLLLLCHAIPAYCHGAANSITLAMPREGWATVAINDAGGVRVRNLFGDMHFTQGDHVIEWDGCDDNGRPVAPGEYHWVGLTRGEIHDVYRGTFQHGTPPWLFDGTGGWTGDHSSAATVAAVGDRVLLGSDEAEAGHGLIATDRDGNKQWGVRWLEKRSWCGVEALAVVGSRVFASSFQEQNAVWEVDPATGNNWLVLEKGDLPPDKVNTEPMPPSTSAPGLRVIGGHKAAGNDKGEVYVADAFGREPRTYVFAPGNPGEKLKLLRVLRVRPWGLAWLPDGRCVAVLDKTLGILNTTTGETAPFVSEGLSAPHGIATDAKGRVYVSDQGDTGLYRFLPEGQLKIRALRLQGESSQQVKIFDSAGHLLRALGLKGGQQPGKIDPEAFWQPAGVAVDSRGKLWVTEFTLSPKRVSVWDIPDDPGMAAAPRLVNQFFGPAMYGGGAAMVDPLEPGRIMDTNTGAIFDMNIQSGVYKALDLPWRIYDTWKEHGYRPDLPFMGAPGVVFNLDGRRFTAFQGGYGNGPQSRWEPERFEATGPVMIGEYKGDVFVPQAAIGNLRMWMRDRETNCRREDQWMPPVILEAARKLPDWPKVAAQMGIAPDASDVPHLAHARNSGVWIANPWPREISGFIWTDANGDGRMQADEIQFHDMPDGESVTLDHQLNAFITAQRGGGAYRLRRDGFNKIGAPVYKWGNLEKISDDRFQIDQVGDDGTMLSFGALRSPQGKVLWSYPINPKGVRDLGADKRMTLEPGRIFRVNVMQGVAQGPGDLGPVYYLHSVDGMSYLMTREDGLFIATLFRPYAFADTLNAIPEAKLGMELEKYSLGEEVWGGHFVRAEASEEGFTKDHYYLLGLGRSLVTELTGIESVKRLSGGTVLLVKGAGLYGKGEHFEPGAIAQALSIHAQQPGPLVAAIPRPGAEAFSAKPAQFGSATLWAAWDNRGLHIKCNVDDPTPFINNDSDWTLAFTTGDAVDMQLKSPKLGRCRYVITMNQGKPVIVRLLYDGADTGHSVSYRSSTGETRVPDVEQLPVQVNVRRAKTSYSLQVTLPWDVLGIDPKSGLDIPMELGLFYSDPTGHKTVSREYWHSQASGMVSDVPTEARSTADWGVLKLQ